MAEHAEGTSGLLTSGGSGANLTAMIAARHHVTSGDASVIAKLTVYASDQTHSSVTRAAWLAGVPRQNVRLLPSDAEFRARPDALRDAVARDRASGLVPLMIVANAGTTNTGSVDPMHEIAELCEREKVWMHVDAAYGGFAVLTDFGRRALAGIERADSVTLDPHKWLFVPFECGCLLVRDTARLKAAFQIFPDTSPTRRRARGGELRRLWEHSRAIRAPSSLDVGSLLRTDAIRDAIERGMALLVAGGTRSRHAETQIGPPQLRRGVLRACPDHATVPPSMR